MKRAAPFSLVGLAMILAVALLVVQATSLATISHDDGISYLAATGHQGSYEHGAPSNEWVQASTWQSFWAPNECGAYTLI